MWKYICAWVPMVPIAIGNAAIRENLFAGRFSELQAHQMSTFTGVLLFGIYIGVLIRFMKPGSSGQAWTVGFIWLGMTVAFEFLFGHYVIGHPWRVLFQDYNICAGRVWIVILIWITAAPYFFYRLRK